MMRCYMVRFSYPPANGKGTATATRFVSAESLEAAIAAVKHRFASAKIDAVVLQGYALEEIGK